MRAAQSDRSRESPWIWGRTADVAIFGGSAALALALVPLGPLLSVTGALPAWGFLALVVGVDVAHVWTSIFRTYLDREELARRPLLYAGVPVACFVIGAALHLVSSVWFWRALAYTAVFHFVRQQAGWVAVYRARAGERGTLDRVIDDAAIYVPTLYPLIYWHAHLPRAFDWFVEGDFLAVPISPSFVSAMGTLAIVALGVYAVRAIQRGFSGSSNPGKHIVVGTTAATWFTGIVATNTDFQFTAANVVVHGVPYTALLYVYAKERAVDRPVSAVASVVKVGFAGFYGLVLILAFAEEMVWDRLVWHTHPTLFGGHLDAPELGRIAKALLVPLLAVPQATHYVLDAVLWRKKDARRAQSRAQAAAMGFKWRRAE